MKPENKDQNCLAHIYGYCQEIYKTTQRFGEEQEIFLTDSVYRNAVALCVLQIGELVTVLSEEYKDAHGEIPWKQIKAVRNIVAHSYGTVDAETLWEIVQKDIPELASFCEKELDAEEREYSNDENG